MNDKCEVGKDGHHSLIPIYIEKTEKFEVARNFMCQWCARIIGHHEIVERDSKMNEEEKVNAI